MLQFDGAIAGCGTASGTRFVVGMWPSSPLGSFADVMIEEPDGHRVLLAPSSEVAEFVRATYSFDDTRITPVRLSIVGRRWSIDSEPLQLEFAVGRRPAVGVLLWLLPRRVARARWFATVVDPFAARLMPGVRTRGSAGNSRREWYCAQDLHAIDSVRVRWLGADMGRLRPVEPPVRFGFGSTPVRPSLARITTLIDLGS